MTSGGRSLFIASAIAVKCIARPMTRLAQLIVVLVAGLVVAHTALAQALLVIDLRTGLPTKSFLRSSRWLSRVAC